MLPPGSGSLSSTKHEPWQRELPLRYRKQMQLSNQRFLSFVVYTLVHSLVTIGCESLKAPIRRLDSQLASPGFQRQGFAEPEEFLLDGIQADR